jgi:hypothetical protein
MENKIVAIFGGETENYNRFKIEGEKMNARIYIRKDQEIPGKLRIQLPIVRVRESGQVKEVLHTIPKKEKENGRNRF